MRIIPIFLPQAACRYHCIYCDQRAISGQTESTFDKISAGLTSMLRACSNPNELEVAFYGGSFTLLPVAEQERLLRLVETIFPAQSIPAIRISTTPAAISTEIITRLVAGGVKTIELGVQSLDRQVLKRSGRPDYGVEEVAKASRLIRSAGVALGHQLMVGLPGDAGTFLESVRLCAQMQPDFVRLYPLLVLAGTPLAKLYYSGAYKPLALETVVDLAQGALEIWDPLQIKVIRMGLCAQPQMLEKLLAGPFHPALRSLVESALWRRVLEKFARTAGAPVTAIVPPPLASDLVGHKRSNLAYFANYQGPAVKISCTGTGPGVVLQAKEQQLLLTRAALWSYLKS